MVTGWAWGSASELVLESAWAWASAEEWAPVSEQE